MAGDGQVSFNNMVLKHGARKVRRIYHDQILAGFAGLPRMRLRSLPNLKRNSRSIEAICHAPRSNWRRIGAPTASYVASKPCSPWRTSRTR